MITREIEIADAEAFGYLLEQVDASSEYMLWEAGERKSELKQQQSMIQNIKDRSNSMIFVAENRNEEMIGYLFAIGGNANRNKHAVYMVIGIAEKARGQGVGTSLFREMERWAIQQQIHRLELTVAIKNEAGLALYKKMGFEIEGIKRDALRIDGAFVDEYYMAKLMN